MSWDDLKNVKSDSGKGIFINLKDGDSVEGVFMGEPRIFYKIFNDNTEYEEKVEGSSFRFKVNFIEIGSGDPVAKVFEQGITVKDQVINAKEEYGIDCVFKIKRTGSSKDNTKYFVTFRRKLDDDELKYLQRIPLRSLRKTDDLPF